MTRLEVFSALLMVVGATLLLSLARWFGRAPLVDRLRPYAPGGFGAGASQGVLSVASFRDVIGPLSNGLGSRVSRAFGVSDDLDRRLQRLHSPMNSTQFRTRQLGWSTASLIGALVIGTAINLGPIPILVLGLATPLVTFLLLEQQVTAASVARQRRLFQELPVVAEQLGMQLGAGYSLGAAMHRIARRGTGVAAEDLALVLARTSQGLTNIEALREWAELSDVDALDRLVGVLALNHEAADLGTLISDEARAIRREAHRELLESIERKDQQVWIPVAIAALIPGTILIAIPFIQAMRTFSTG